MQMPRQGSSGLSAPPAGPSPAPAPAAATVAAPAAPLPASLSASQSAGGLRAALRDSALRRWWRALKARRREALLTWGPVLARRRAAAGAAAEARLRAFAEADPDRARALARRLVPGAAGAAAAAILTARRQGWEAAAPLFARLGPPPGAGSGAGSGAGAGGAAAALLRRGAPGPALDLIPPRPARPATIQAALPAAEAAGLVVYTTRFGPEARALPPPGAVAGARFLCLSDRDDPAAGWEIRRVAPPESAPPESAPPESAPARGVADPAAWARIDPEAALAAAGVAAGASLYLAPEILLHGNLHTLVARWLGQAEIAAWRHPRAAGWQDLAEGAALAAAPGRARDAVLAQARGCEAAGLDREAGAYDTRLLWRRHGPEARALAAAWAAALAEAPGDPDLALARALADPAVPRPRVLPAALGRGGDSLFAAALPPARRAATGRAGARRKVALVYARGYEGYAATALRGEQLAGLLADRLEDFEIAYTPETEGLRDQVVVLTKWALETRKPEEIARLRARNVAVVASWDDKIPVAGIAEAVDAQMSLSIRQTIELNRRWPRVPTFFVTHHVNRLVRPQRPPMDRIRTGYFGDLINTTRPASLAAAVALNGVTTTRKSDGSWMDALDRYNCHWIVRRRHVFDGAKPFLKGFLAARCGATVLVARDDGDAACYLGDDYPFYVAALDDAALEAAWLEASAAFGGPDWALAQAIMAQVAERSDEARVAAEFRAMVEELTA